MAVGAFEAKSLIAAMGGRLTVESRPGEGSLLHHHPSRRRSGARNPTEKRMSDNPIPAAELPVLLIVEDDEGLQRQLKWAYEGYRVIGATDRAQAIEMVRLHEPAVVTLDLGLPPDPDGTSEGFATLTEDPGAEARHQGHRRVRPWRARKRAQGHRARAPMISTASRSISTSLA